MAEYLLNKGIEKNRILIEDKSTNTVENIQNSKALLDDPYNGVGIVTNNFHVFRAVQIAKRQGVEGCCFMKCPICNNEMIEGGLVIDGVVPGWVPMENFRKKY